MTERFSESMDASTEKEETNEKDELFERAKQAIEAGERREFFERLNEAMAGLGNPDAVEWQKVARDIYAAGSRKLGKEEMATAFDEYLQDPDTREWLFGDL